MNIKYCSWFFAILTSIVHILGVINFLYLFFGISFIFWGFVTIIYIHHKDLDEFVTSRHPLEAPRKLGLNLVSYQKPVVLITPNVKIQTPAKSKSPHHSSSKQQQRSQNASLDRKRSLIDSGIELLFKKHGKPVKEGHFKANDVYLESRDSSTSDLSRLPCDDKKWNPFENIKIYTEKKKSSTHGREKTGGDRQNRDEYIYENIPNKYNLSMGSDGHLLDERGSPRKKQKSVLSGNQKIDNLLHTLIDYIIRDFIDSWFSFLSDNKEFSEFRVRNCIEQSISNICLRVKNVHWIPLLTTKLVEDIANHTRMYRLAQQSLNPKNDDKSSLGVQNTSPQRKTKKSQHKRNKSDTDLKWYQGSNTPNKNATSSKFHSDTREDKTVDTETGLSEAFFKQNDLYKNECLNEYDLEKYLTHIMETILYFTLPEEDFACLPLRTFLSTLLANAVFKPLVNILSDPDFINLQVAKLFAKEPPPSEYFIKALRQSTNITELRACRQLITREMNSKYKDTNAAPELASLKYTQKLIDLRINCLQNTKDIQNIERDHVDTKLPLVSLDELLFKEIARSYFLDYLSIQNLQKYVIFYLTADEWKMFTTQTLTELHSSKIKGAKDDIYRTIRDKAQNIYREYLVPNSENFLDVDKGLIDALSFKLQDPMIIPENSWFDSLCKFVYEKLKNESAFLTKFYQSEAYRKLLLELEFVGQNPESDIEMNITHINVETGSDTNSGDLNFDDSLTDTDAENNGLKGQITGDILKKVDLLDAGSFKHTRSHSDCTGIVPSFSDSSLETKNRNLSSENEAPSPKHVDVNGALRTHLNVLPSDETYDRPQSAPLSSQLHGISTIHNKQRLTAKIINTAILCEGQYAVYAIHVSIIEESQHKSWHIYRRYSKFLELKKLLVKMYAPVAKIPFPAKKAFQNTQRSVLEHRMVLLNEFLRILCLWAEDHDDMMRTLREFLEPDTDDRKIHGGVVIRTIETLVNPLKTGMKTIRNMPDTLVGGFSKILLGKGPLKEPSFLEVNPMCLEHSSEFPALTSALHLLDEVFDLQARSQWLRRGIINRLLGAPWVSHTANKRVIHAAKSLIATDKIEQLLGIVLNNLWPHGKRLKKSSARDQNAKLRTKVGARMALFALLSDDLKHVVGSETTRSGLLNLYSMWQHQKLNLRLMLVLSNDILTTIYRVESMTKHVKN